MPKNPHADFSPVLDGYSGIGAFRFWCQTALPLTYDDSLSYYELLCKVVNYLNHAIEDLSNIEENTDKLAEAYTKLQNYVNEYFDKLDIEAELRNVLDAMAQDGTLDALLDPLVTNHLPGVVDDKIDDVVADQIDDAVAGQIDNTVAQQLPAVVATDIPAEVTNWLTSNVNPVGSAVMVDSSLTISGAAADAKVTGDEVSNLKTHLDDIAKENKSKNLYNPATDEVGYLNENTGNVNSASTSSRTSDFIEIGENVVISAIRSMAGVGLRVCFFDEDKTYMSGLLVPRSDETRDTTLGRTYVVLTVPQNAKYLRFSSNAISTGYTFNWQVENNTVPTAYEAYFAPFYNVKYSALPEELIDRLDSVDDRLDDVDDRLDDVDDRLNDAIKISKNILNRNAITEHAYVTPTNVQDGSSYSQWFISDYIDVLNGAEYLQANFPLYSIIFYDENNVGDTVNSYNGLHTAATLPFAIPSTAKKIRISGKETSLSRDLMMNFGSELLPYEKYGRKYFNEQMVENSIKENPTESKINHGEITADYLSNYKQALKKNVVVAYSANFTTFTSLMIGFTKTTDYTADYLNYFEITDTNVILHRLGYADITWAHELTIKDYIGIEITFNFSLNFTLKVTTNGGVFTKTNYIYITASCYPFAILTATGVDNKKLSISCKDLRKNIMMFGDSYFSNGASRWLYYLTDEEKDNLCINGYAGESSATAVNDLDVLVKIGSPKFIVWCLGMNDGSDTDNSTPSAAWTAGINHLLEVCEKYNITPILATIPTVPSINNHAKSSWVRNSGYAYIDFAKAVENPNYNSATDEPLDIWYSGMLNPGTEEHPDLVHPTADGAKVLFARAITDYPDLLINN